MLLLCFPELWKKSSTEQYADKIENGINLQFHLGVSGNPCISQYRKKPSGDPQNFQRGTSLRKAFKFEQMHGERDGRMMKNQQLWI